jgi:hypothetical protein
MGFMSKTQPNIRDKVRTTDRRAMDVKVDINELVVGHVGVDFKKTGS